ncbi:MAG TPA: ANTAR domain-containing protein [Mycobacterium sp.]|nr:ANTAR domain-containing protein [Mycobacterium sp.]
MTDRVRHPEFASRRVIDVAVGILIAVRRCSQEEAFEEIAHAVHETGVPLGSIARALVSVATATSEQSPHTAQALRLWGDLLPATGDAKR